MARDWDPNAIGELIGRLTACGEELARTGSAPDANWQALRAELDYRGEQPARWIERAVGPVIPTGARRPLTRLMWNLASFYRGSSFTPRQAVPALGEAAWDLGVELEREKTPTPGHIAAAVRRVWPERPGTPHVQRLTIRNFRCFREVQVPLEPLTVLVGPNDSGKSVFLSAVEAVVNGSGPTPQDRWRGEVRLETEISADTSFGPCRVGTVGEAHAQPALQPATRFHFPSHGVPMTSSGFSDAKDVPSIGGAGDMVPALFDYLLRQQRPRFFAARDALVKLIPGLVDLNIGTPKANERRVDLLLENGFLLPADQASTGVRLILTFVALAYHPTPPRVILLEEPETGVHPKRLKDIVGLLRGLTRGEFGERPAQVIMTTHSPHLLSFIDPDEDQVLVFRRLEDGSRTADPVDRERLKIFLDEFTLGEVWFNVGEEGLVKRA